MQSEPSRTRCGHGFARTRRTSGTKAYSKLCQNRVRKDEHEDEALRLSLPDSGMRRGRRQAPVLPVSGVRRTGPVETTSRHVGEETSREGLHDGCEAHNGRECRCSPRLSE
jgi:hypothetical protein